jgi:hypothetical protein
VQWCIFAQGINMAAISQPARAWAAADAIWRSGQAIHQGANVAAHIIALRNQALVLEEVRVWADRTARFSYKGNNKVRNQLANAAISLNGYIVKLEELIASLELQPAETSTHREIMFLATSIKSINYAPATKEQATDHEDAKDVPNFSEGGTITQGMIAAALKKRSIPHTPIAGDPLDNED